MNIDIQAWFFLPLSFIISFVSVPVLIKLAKERNLFDMPDFDRKLHTRVTPTMGGASIYIAFLVGFGVSGYTDALSGYGYLVSGLTILFFTGIKDDIITVSPRFKLISQVFSAFLAMYGCNLMITSFGGVFGVGLMPDMLSVSLTLFTFIVITNAYNLIDGIDGLAVGIGIISSIVFGIGFLVSGNIPFAVLSFFVASSMLGFLVHNFSPASIFMGDTGSLVVGFLLSVMAVKFVSLPEQALISSVYSKTAPVLAIAVLSLPLYDTLRVFIKRVASGKSPFTPGKDHVHHVLLDMGFSHAQSAIILYTGTIILTTTIILLSVLSINMLLAVVVLGMFVVYPTVGYKRRLFTFLFGKQGQRMLKTIKLHNLPNSPEFKPQVNPAYEKEEQEYQQEVLH